MKIIIEYQSVDGKWYELTCYDYIIKDDNVEENQNIAQEPKRYNNVCAYYGECKTTINCNKDGFSCFKNREVKK